jgi:hypothetical protein
LGIAGPLIQDSEAFGSHSFMVRDCAALNPALKLPLSATGELKGRRGMKRLLVGVLWTAMSAAVYGQAPPLAQRVVLGQPEVQLTNKYTSRATAWMAEYELAPETQGPNRAWAWHDYTLEPGTTLNGIAAGSSERWKPDSDTKGRFTGIRFRILAVLYEDGAAFGDAPFARTLLEVRQFAYNDAAEDVRLLEDFQKQRGGDFGALVRQFEERVARHLEELASNFRAPEGAPPIRPHDPVCAAILLHLKQAQSGADADKASEVEAGKIAALRYYDLLRSSKPELRPVGDPAAWQTAGVEATGNVTRMEAAWRLVPDASVAEARLRNTYEAAATAWVVETRYGSGPPPEVRYADELLAEHPQPLLPGAAIYSSMPISAGRVMRTVEVVGVIYADGATAGQQKYIDSLLARRRVIFSSLATVLLSFMEAEARQAANRAAILQKLETCAAQIQSFMDQAGIPGGDFLCAPAARELHTPDRPVERVISRYGPRFEVVYQRLRSSKPAPQPAQTGVKR